MMRPINLPAHLIGPPTVILGLGLYISLFRRPPSLPAQASSKEQGKGRDTARQFLVPTPATPRIADTNALLGIITSALMLPYFVSSYMPIAENQWLHASVPIRLWISAMLIGNVLLRRKTMSREGYWEFLMLGVMDGVSAFALGNFLGRFDGRVPSL
ncbi:hypothetical protein BJX66DRAFT_316472 [Aspergillus keveii]|uniref:Uncharacterized protein n=1 Tax=Aspergillus keveii TaxID=714993 RepID=A0ABR4FMV1_9EURO